MNFVNAGISKDMNRRTHYPKAVSKGDRNISNPAGESVTEPASQQDSKPAATVNQEAGTNNVYNIQTTVHNTFIDFTKNDILRGFIYSEILGSPRAKRRGRW